MRRLIVLASVLALILVGAPAGSAAPLEPTAYQTRDRLHGDPFTLASPAAWLPVLEQTGDMQQAALAAQASLRITYNLYALGDANRDGKEDFLLVNTTVDDGGSEYIQESLVRAVSGSDFATLWTVSVPDNSYWFVLGDIDGDSVDDLVVATSTMTGTTQSQGANGVSVYRSERSTKYSWDVIAGASGKRLFPLTCEAPYTYTTARAAAPVASAFVTDRKWAICHLVEVSGGGIDLFQENIVEMKSAQVSAFVAGAGARFASDSLKIQRYNGAGQKSWEWSFAADNVYGYIPALADFNGDKVQDFVHATFPEEPIYAYSLAGGQGVVVPQPGKLTMVDGKTGRQAWTIDVASDALEMNIAEAALRDASTKDLIVSEFRQVDAPVGAWQTTIRQINGGTGATLDARVLKDKIAAVLEHDDVDGDGRDELFLVQAKVKAVPLDYPEIDESIEFSVVEADLSAVWGPRQFKDSDYWVSWMSDFDLTGDGVDDFLVESTPEDSEDDREALYRFFSGSDGSPIWDYRLTSKVVTLDVVGDVDGTAGDDVAITLFDIPDEQLRKPAPSGGPASQTAGPASPAEEANELNFANYVGRLELRRGTDRELVWEKKVHDPKEVQNVTANAVYSFTPLIPDTNGDGAPELLFNFETPRFYLVTNGGNYRVEEQREGLVFALLISGLDGKTLKSYPDDKGQAPALIGRAARPKAIGGEASAEGNVPALAPLLVLLAIVIVASVRRRHA